MSTQEFGVRARLVSWQTSAAAKPMPLGCQRRIELPDSLAFCFRSPAVMLGGTARK